MQLRTVSGLRGQLIEFRQDKLNSKSTSGVALVERTEFPFEGRPYAVTYVETDTKGDLVAALSEYDLTYAEGLDELDRRTRRGKYAR